MRYSVEDCRDHGHATGRLAVEEFKRECTGKGSDVLEKWLSLATAAHKVIIQDMIAAGASDEAIFTYWKAFQAELTPSVENEFGRLQTTELLKKAGIPTGE